MKQLEIMNKMNTKSSLQEALTVIREMENDLQYK
jgi:hypothetical protein